MKSAGPLNIYKHFISKEKPEAELGCMATHLSENRTRQMFYQECPPTAGATITETQSLFAARHRPSQSLQLCLKDHNQELSDVNPERARLLVCSFISGRPATN